MTGIPSFAIEPDAPVSTADSRIPHKLWRRPSVRRWMAVGVVLGLLVALQLVGSNGEPRAFDPNSARPNGTKAFVLLMQRAGARVVEDSKPQGEVAVLLDDTLSQRETDDLEEWVRSGGTLVVSDTYSSLMRGSLADVDAVPKRLEPRCDSSIVDGVVRISPHRKHLESFFEQSDGAMAQCFPDRTGKAFFLQGGHVGKGAVVQVGGSEIFTNDRLDKDDNSVLVTNLIRPSSSTVLTILDTRDVGSSEPAPGSGGLSQLIPVRLKDAFWMLVGASVIFILWRWRRLGDPVEEDPLVRIPASQLITATGDLLELAEHHQAAGLLLRDDLRKTLCDRFGLRRDIDDDALVALVGGRTGIDPARLRSALHAGAQVAGAQQLVQYAQQMERLKQEVSHVR